MQEKKPKTPKKKTTAFDYSKWDHLDSDSDAETIEHTSGENVWAAPPPNDAVDAARFVILCASLSSYGLCGGATWTEADVTDCLGNSASIEIFFRKLVAPQAPGR